MTENLATEAADLLEELGLQLYRVTDDKEALDDALDMAERLRDVSEPEELGVLHDVREKLREPKLDEGDTVYDKDADHEWQMGPFEVVEVTDVPAEEYVIGENKWGPNATVADKNTGYDRQEPVIVATPDGSDKEYAYPRSRLEVR